MPKIYEDKPYYAATKVMDEWLKVHDEELFQIDLILTRLMQRTEFSTLGEKVYIFDRIVNSLVTQFPKGGFDYWLEGNPGRPKAITQLQNYFDELSKGNLESAEEGDKEVADLPESPEIPREKINIDKAYAKAMDICRSWKNYDEKNSTNVIKEVKKRILENDNIAMVASKMLVFDAMVECLISEYPGYFFSRWQMDKERRNFKEEIKEFQLKTINCTCG